jgi:hypothetical protein
MSLTAVERETIITMNDEDRTIQIQTAQRPIITSLLNNPSAEILEDYLHDGTRMVTATLPAGMITLRGKKRSRSNEGNHFSDAPKCGAKKKDGTKCQMVATKETGRCRWHPPKGKGK